MAKRSMIERELKRAKLVKRYAKKRAALKATIRDLTVSDEERILAQEKLNAMPRDASPVRQRRPASRLLPEVRPVPEQAQGRRDARRDSRADQGELVGGDRI